jgi:hypothetical protein
MLAGRPHEAVGNGSPRWMTAAPRKRAHRTRPTGRLTPTYLSDLGRSGQRVLWFRPCSVRATANIVSIAPPAEILSVGKEMPVGIHRLGDGGVTEPGLNDLRVQVGGDQRRGVEVAQVVKSGSLRQAVREVGAYLAAAALFRGRGG